MISPLLQLEAVAGGCRARAEVSGGTDSRPTGHWEDLLWLQVAADVLASKSRLGADLQESCDLTMKKKSNVTYDPVCF